jgi:hypothetical protein
MDDKKTARSIAAPFQNRSNDITTIVESDIKLASPINEFTDFRNFTFVPLKPLSQLSREEVRKLEEFVHIHVIIL